MAANPYLSFCSFGGIDCEAGNCRGMPIQAPIDKLGREKGATTSAATLVMVDYHSNTGPRSRDRDERYTSVEGLPVARTGSGGSADDRSQVRPWNEDQFGFQLNPNERIHVTARY
jgi:hypothetical protein